jgi:protein-glucosylgalactosylhydroxylysine glucosidase
MKKPYLHKYTFPYLITLLFLILAACGPIKRENVLGRHHPVMTQFDSLSPLSVGNGEFAFTADLTGMQTFPEKYEKGISLGTYAQWGWHSFPNPAGYQLNDVAKNYQAGDRQVPYWYQFSPDDDPALYEATEWLRENPHRLHLGIIGMEIVKRNGLQAGVDDIENPRQHLNLWTGVLTSTFEIEGSSVKVITVCHQEKDQLSFQISSDLLAEGRIKINIRYPYAARGKFNHGYDFAFPEKHSTLITSQNTTGARIERTLDADRYSNNITYTEGTKLIQSEKHTLFIAPPANQNVFELNCAFAPAQKSINSSSFAENLAVNEQHWPAFWESGAAIDFKGSSDPRAHELERRVVLSQYLTKIQCSGSLPPQETGLTTNSWYGKFHLEMHWWHALHFILWNRPEQINQQIEYYFNIFHQARETARMQGYAGARWPKMTDYRGIESPSNIGVFLIWQQPHIIYLTHLLAINSTNEQEVLLKHLPLIEATADFMASYARFDSLEQRYFLGPALIPAQERFDPDSTINPVFELAYWKWALQTAQEIRSKLGLPQNKEWQHVIDHLSPLPVSNGRYLFTENANDTYTRPEYFTDHPMVLALAGFLPMNGDVKADILGNTLNTVMERWDWQTAWGWDFPMAAMCAALLNRPDDAIDLLLMDVTKNRYLSNGHNYQSKQLPLYLPGNGALLTAVATLATLTDPSGKNFFETLPGWKVRYENFGKNVHHKQDQP